MAQPAIDQNNEAIRKARLESKQARKRNAEANRQRASFQSIEEGDTIDQQSLQTATRGATQPPFEGQPAGEASPYRARRRRGSARGRLPDNAVRAQFAQQQNQARMAEAAIEQAQTLQKQKSAETKQEQSGKLVDFTTGTLGPMMGATDTASGGSSLIVTVFVWPFLILWWDIKAYLGPKLKGTPLGYIITPLRWGSIIAPLAISPSAEEALEDKGKPYLYGALGLINLLFLIAVGVFGSMIMLAAYVLIQIADDPIAFIYNQGGTFGSMLIDLF